jgi:opacity protein-like surface antigen/outer membrane protein OmpA-like peptidoglycan-associated protein
MRSSLRMIATAAFAVLLMPAFLLHTGEAAAQTSAATPYASGQYIGAPRAELFVGYSYLRAIPAPTTGNRLMWMNGGSTSLALNFNRYLGIVGDFGAYTNSQMRFQGGYWSTVDVDNPNVGAFSYLFGPRISFRSHSRVTPFVQALFGGMHANEVSLSHCTFSCTFLPSENTFAWAAGGGLDVRVRRHFAIRLIQAEYLMTRFPDYSTGLTTSQNDMRLSSGIVFRFGGHTVPPLPPPEPLSYSCSVNPPSVFSGEPIAASGTALNLNPAKTAVYTWQVDGGTVTGVSSTAKIDTTNLAVGAYTLKCHVSEGDRPSENADATAAYAVKVYEPPTVSCVANPANVMNGESSTITATGVSPQNRPLTYSYSSTSGSISGNGTTAILSTVGAPLGPDTVTCNVVDDKGQAASGTTLVTIAAPFAAPKPMTSELCSIHFDRDARRPSRVDNEGKACLDEVALNLQRSPDAKLAVVGNSASAEKGGKKLATERAVDTKAYLVTEKGIDSSRIAVYTGPQNGKIVSTTLIPAGATFDATGDTPVN